MTKNWTKNEKKKKNWIKWGEKIGKNKWLELKKKFERKKNEKKFLKKILGQVRFLKQCVKVQIIKVCPRTRNGLKNMP